MVIDIRKAAAINKIILREKITAIFMPPSVTLKPKILITSAESLDEKIRWYDAVIRIRIKNGARRRAIPPKSMPENLNRSVRPNMIRK